MLPRLTATLAAAGGFWLLLLAVGRGELEGPLSTETSRSASAGDATADNASADRLAGDALIRTAAGKLRNQQSVAARVRLRVQMFDTELLGAGIYLQLAGQGLPRFLWELRIQVAGETSSLVQVADGRFLWTDRILPSGQTITRVDLMRLTRRGAPPGIDPMASLRGRGLAADPFASGGLPRLLRALGEHYQFRRAEGRSLLGLPVHSVAGTVRQGPNRLLHADGWLRHPAADPAPEPPLEAATTTDGDVSFLIPSGVRVCLGRDDLFPYLVEYFASGGENERAPAVPVLRIQLHDVQLDGPIDDRRFVYTPGDPNWDDITDDLLERGSVPAR